MPIDHKRINGPENSEPYQLYSDARKITVRKEIEQILKGARNDGRKSDELRKICKYEILCCNSNQNRRSRNVTSLDALKVLRRDILYRQLTIG